MNMHKQIAPLIIYRGGIGVLVLSYDAPLIRLAATDAGIIAFWRGTLISLPLMAFFLTSDRRC